MQGFLLPKQWCMDLDKWLTTKLKHSIKAAETTDSEFWYQITKVKSLTRLAIAKFIGIHYSQVLNKNDTLIYQIIKEEITTEDFGSATPTNFMKNLKCLEKISTDASEWDSIANILLLLNHKLIDAWQTSLQMHKLTHSVPLPYQQLEDLIQFHANSLIIFTDASYLASVKSGKAGLAIFSENLTLLNSV